MNTKLIINPIVIILYITYTLILCVNYAQNKVIIDKNDKVTLKSIPSKKNDEVELTIHIEFISTIDCDEFENYYNGWYNIKGDEKKNQIIGYSMNCKLFFYDTHNNPDITTNFIKKIKSKNQKFEQISNKFFVASNKKISFDFCDKGNSNYIDCIVIHKNKNHNILFKYFNNIGMPYEYYILPNNQKIELTETFTNYRGNKYLCSYHDKTENRIIFKLSSNSNHDYCGMCGGSEGEIGYGILYFTKDWKIKKTEQYMINSCNQRIEPLNESYNKKTKIQTYEVEDYFNYVTKKITVNINNSTITTKNIKKINPDNTD